MSEKKVKNFKIEGAKMIFRNFSGKQNDYNKEGDRNFGLLLGDEDAEKLKEDGWNVKYRPPLPDDPTGYQQPWLPVKVKFGEIPPMIYMVLPKGVGNDTNPKKIRLDEDTVGQLDWAAIEFSDMIIRPYCYPPSNFKPEGGIAAYLKTLYATIKQDDLDVKYGLIPEIGDFEEE